MNIEIGARYGRLRLVALNNDSTRANDKAEFLCDCGASKGIRIFHVMRGITVSCGCVKRKHAVELGQRIGRLTVCSTELIRVGKKLKVMCKCDCGTEKAVGVPELATGDTRSCGCLVVEQITALSLKHGGEGTPLYSVWHGIKTRCLNELSANYDNYGGRGIQVCQDWSENFQSFQSWALQNGYAAGLQIDRIDVNGNYEPGNCRWATSMVNGNNRRNNVRLTAFGEVMTMKDWSRDSRCVVSYSTLKQRIRKGWPHLDAINTPSGAR